MSQAVADHLQRALDLLRRDGWHQQCFSEERSLCPTSAVCAAGFIGYVGALDALAEAIGLENDLQIHEWNQAPGRKFEEVEAAFLKAIERERAA